MARRLPQPSDCTDVGHEIGNDGVPLGCARYRRERCKLKNLAVEIAANRFAEAHLARRQIVDGITRRNGRLDAAIDGE